MANFISNLFGRKNISVLGVDIGSSAIKIVQLTRRHGRAVLETYGELALGPYAGGEIGQATNLPPEKISESLIDLMREAKVTTNLSAFSISYASSLITIIEMPAVPERELASMIPLEARKYIPVALSEVALDWSVIPKAPSLNHGRDFGDHEVAPVPSDKLDVLLVAIHQDTISRYQTIVEQSKLAAQFFEIEIFSTVRSVLDQDTVGHMIVDLGAASTKVYVVERGIVRVSHVINRGSQDITLAISAGLNVSVREAEAMKRDISSVSAINKANVKEVTTLALDYVFLEANRVMLDYQKRQNKNISLVTLVGGGARLEGVVDVAKKHLQVDVAIGDPFNKTQAPVFLEDTLKHTGPEFAVAIGVALRRLQEFN